MSLAVSKDISYAYHVMGGIKGSINVELNPVKRWFGPFSILDIAWGATSSMFFIDLFLALKVANCFINYHLGIDDLVIPNFLISSSPHVPADHDQRAYFHVIQNIEVVLYLVNEGISESE